MVNNILFMYAIGFVFFILSLEEADQQMNRFIYIGLSIFMNTIAYYMSYTDVDYTTLAYFPLGLLSITVLLMAYLGFQYISVIASDEYTDTGED